MKRSQVSFAQVVVFYLLSGSLGLIYEVTFSKYLGYSFGATAAASSAVLVAFMGGITIGAYASGRIARRVVRPLLAYGAVEIAIGLFCLLAPSLFGHLSSAYVSLAAKTGSLTTLTVVRGLVATVIVALPAVGMGSTLPLLTRFIHGMFRDTEAANARNKLAALYGVNTLGGAIGSLASAYLVIPALGLSWTLRGAALVSVTVGIVSIAIGRTFRVEAFSPSGDATPNGDPEPVEPGEPATLTTSDALFLAGLSGLLVFCSEVVFTHLLALVIGTSVYAFGLMLAIFLVCLAVGTPLAHALEQRTSSGALSVSLVITGIALVVSLPIWDRLPALFVALGPHVRSWHGRELVRGIAAFFALSVPVSFMGTTFPLVLRATGGAHAARDVGRMTAVNTIGSIVGSLLAGFVLLERLGSHGSLVLVAFGYLLGGLVAVRRAAPETRRRAGILAAVGLLLAVVLPGWNLGRLTNGANVYFDQGVVENSVLESIHEDVHGGVTTIVRNPVTNERTLLTNGKFQGNDSKEIAQNQGFAYLPSFFAEDTNRALIIGMGTAVTAGALGRFPYAQIDIAELAPAIITAARTTFADVNRHVLEDPRTHVLMEDGRNVLYTRANDYDVITIELTSVWFAGAANLYNREFYDIAKDRLTAGGVLQQWIQFHHTNRRIVATILGTIRKSFSHVSLFADGHQGHILASDEPLHARVRRMETFADQTGIPYDQLLGYVQGIVLDEDAIDAFVNDTAASEESNADDYVSSDDNLALEYATPKGNVPTADDIPTTVKYLYSYQPRGVVKAHLEL
ncbi:MAG TPA: fused MFS/spermidine synthase [Polyangiaceae bacterium]